MSLLGRKTILGRDLRVGDTIIGWWGETPITRLERYLVPAKVLHESVAAANPGGLSGFLLRDIRGVCR